MRTLFGKLLSSYLIVVIVTLLILGVALSYFFENFYLDIQKKKLIRHGRELAALVTAAVYYPNPTEMMKLIRVAERFVDGYVVLLDRTGLVMSSSDSEQALALSPTEVRRVLNGETASKTGTISGFTEPMLQVAVPILGQQGVLGGLVIYAPLAGITTTIGQARGLMMYAALISIILSMLLSWKLSRSISQPLHEMSDIAYEMSKGNFEGKVKVRSRDEVGQLAKTFNFLADELKHTLDNLHREKSKTDSILASMAESVIAVDSRGRIMLVNPRAAELLGRKPQCLQGMSMNEAIPWRDVRQVLTSVFHSGQMARTESHVGGSVYIVHVVPIRESSGSIGGAVAVLQDISERWRVEQMRRDFVANVSHELRTPLTSIQGFGEALLDDVVKDEGERKQFLSIMVDEAQRLGRLVNDLLDMASLQSGERRLDLNRIKMCRLVERVVQKVKPQAEEAGINLSGSISPGISVLCDVDRMEQVLLNLVYNALRHTPRGGEISVQVVADERFVTTVVSDTGEGIPEEDLPHVWERFHKVDKSRSRNKGGTGLGLAIVKQIVELHGGSVGVESELGVGTSFRFSIPRDTRSRAKAVS